jgi:hypothetical protein
VLPRARGRTGASRCTPHGTTSPRARSIRPGWRGFRRDFLWRTGCGGLGPLLGSSPPSLPPRLCRSRIPGMA